MMAKVNVVRELQLQMQEELDALLPSVLRPSGGAFKPLRGATRGEL